MSTIPAAMLTPHRPPPEDYYQNNCLELFEFVLIHYGELLDAEAYAQLRAFSSLEDDAQRLFARLLTRKGPLIRSDSLNYAEITSLTQALEQLAAQAFVVQQPCAPADQLLNLLKKDELAEFAGGALPKSMKKADMVNALLSGCSDQQIRQRLHGYLRWLQIADAHLWWLVRLLYFGDAVQDWSAFVVRDLGMVRYEPVSMQSRRFNSAEALERDLLYRHYSGLSRRVDEFPGLAEDLLNEMLRLEAATDAATDRFVQRRRNRTLVRLGRWHERCAQHELACLAYDSVALHPARERLVRVLHKQGQTAAVQARLEEIRQQPFSDEEAQFAERFGQRGGGYQPEVTEISVAVVRSDVEMQALSCYLDLRIEQGATAAQTWGAYVENSLVRTLTGLLYWDAIFADVPGAFTNPFQFGPNDLYQEDFVTPRRDVIEQIEALTQTDEGLRGHLHAISTRKQGIANSLVSWRLLDAVPLSAFTDAMPAADIRKLCRFMIRNLAERKSGLPDLFVAYGPGAYEFIEVKGPNDQLQPGQRVWLKHFARLQIPARVLKLQADGTASRAAL